MIPLNAETKNYTYGYRNALLNAVAYDCQYLFYENWMYNTEVLLNTSFAQYDFNTKNGH